MEGLGVELLGAVKGTTSSALKGPPSLSASERYICVWPLPQGKFSLGTKESST